MTPPAADRCCARTRPPLTRWDCGPGSSTSRLCPDRCAEERAAPRSSLPRGAETSARCPHDTVFVLRAGWRPKQAFAYRLRGAFVSGKYRTAIDTKIRKQAKQVRRLRPGKGKAIQNRAARIHQHLACQQLVVWPNAKGRRFPKLPASHHHEQALLSLKVGNVEAGCVNKANGFGQVQLVERVEKQAIDIERPDCSSSRGRWTLQ